jgi:glycosyltransferase involved in cell wall biosynthesis
MNEFKNILISHPTGNANVRALLKGLSNEKLLGEFHTTIAIKSDGILHRLAKLNFFSELLKREYLWIDGSKVRVHPYLEFARVISGKLKIHKLLEHESGYFSIDRVYRDLDLKVSKKVNHFDAIYAYEDGALETFKEAKKYNKICFYDLPIGYWRSMRKLLKNEMEERPEWSETLTGFKDSQEKVFRKDQEIKNADIIFVASSFTKKTLEDYPGNLPPIKVVPYGFPEVVKDRVYKPLKDRKLKLLFVGGLSQRKGIANIFEAAEILKDKIELKVIGRKSVNNCSVLNESLKKHNWIPALAHHEILEEMQKSDILLFPSLFEGYGLVITEAMSRGTPVITTNRTCGADLIVDNENGWLVNPGDTQNLVEKIKNILCEKDSIETIGRRALDSAKKMPIDEYGSRMVKELLKTVMS